MLIISISNKVFNIYGKLDISKKKKKKKRHTKTNRKKTVDNPIF